jgi:hypothetical protein
MQPNITDGQVDTGVPTCGSHVLPGWPESAGAAAAPCAGCVADPAATAGLYARLDGLRMFIASSLAAESDERLTLEWAQAEVTALCQEAPAWCPGCPGRGTAAVCCVCGAPISAALRRRGGSSEPLVQQPPSGKVP